MSSVHLPNAHQDDSNLLSQLTEESSRRFDIHHRRHIHLRQQSVENELEVQNQGDGRHHGTGQSELDQEQHLGTDKKEHGFTNLHSVL